MDRVRTLYGKFIEYDPTNVTAWVMFAELEGSLQEEERARSLHELALSQPVLNQPEALWMHYIDFELSVGDRAAARALYERLLERTQHVKVPFPPPAHTCCEVRSANLCCGSCAGPGLRRWLYMGMLV